jgi:hypothetical protein
MTNDILAYGVEGSVTVLILVIAYKIYKMRIHTHSGCCGDRIIIDTQNSGVQNTNIENETKIPI